MSPGARPDYIRQQLAEQDLVPEEWGGQTICVETSATEGTGIDTLLEMLLLEAALLELKANANKAARGIIIEAEVDKERGAVATVLVHGLEPCASEMPLFQEDILEKLGR